MDPPEIRYARSGDVAIAYQVVGEGPVDIVFVPFFSNLESVWRQPMWVSFYGHLASFARLILFDKRGVGLSDRFRELPTLETRMDDVRAVLDALGSERAVLLGSMEGGQMCTVFAATYPERTIALVLFNTVARHVSAPDYPWGKSAEEWRELVRAVRERWGEREFLEAHLRSIDPALADDEGFRRYYVSEARLAWSPGAASAYYRMMADIDIRGVLPVIQVPTLVLWRQGQSEPARYVAERIPGARTRELPGSGYLTPVGTEVAQEVERFLATVRDDRVPDRVLATVLFSDIVGSTSRASTLGDRAWRELLERHHALVRQQLTRFRGQEIDTAGDGFFATFDGPARAILCACAIRAAVAELGLDLRIGLHTGECEIAAGKVTGIAVNTGARVAGAARAGEILVTTTVRDLVAGSGLRFEDRGERQLRGVPQAWRLFAVAP